MKVHYTQIAQLKKHPRNPRRIDKKKLEALKESLETNENMTELRPLVIDERNVVLGGNMKLEAAKELGWKKIAVVQVTGWSDEQKVEFLVKDNTHYGNWDWSRLANEWNAEELEDFGLDLWQIDSDTGIDPWLGADLEEEVEDALEDESDTEGQFRTIMVEVPEAEYEKALEMARAIREEGGTLGAVYRTQLEEELNTGNQ